MSERKLSLKIIGMSCEHCEKSVMNAVMEVKGVQRANVDHRASAAEVIFDDEVATQEQIIKAVDDLEVYQVVQNI